MFASAICTPFAIACRRPPPPPHDASRWTDVLVRPTRCYRGGRRGPIETVPPRFVGELDDRVIARGGNVGRKSVERAPRMRCDRPACGRRPTRRRNNGDEECRASRKAPTCPCLVEIRVGTTEQASTGRRHDEIVAHPRSPRRRTDDVFLGHLGCSDADIASRCAGTTSQKTWVRRSIALSRAAGPTRRRRGERAAFSTVEGRLRPSASHVGEASFPSFLASSAHCRIHGHSRLPFRDASFAWFRSYVRWFVPSHVQSRVSCPSCHPRPCLRQSGGRTGREEKGGTHPNAPLSRDTRPHRGGADRGSWREGWVTKGIVHIRHGIHVCPPFDAWTTRGGAFWMDGTLHIGADERTVGEGRTTNIPPRLWGGPILCDTCRNT